MGCGRASLYRTPGFAKNAAPFSPAHAGWLTGYGWVKGAAHYTKADDVSTAGDEVTGERNEAPECSRLGLSGSLGPLPLN